MHRTRNLFAKAGLTLALSLVVGSPLSAELIHAPGGRAYPDLAGAITGSQSYTYDPATQTGTFQVTNTPFLLTTGPSATNEAVVQPNPDGIRNQVVNLTLDQNGRLVSDANNSYSLYGTVVLGGKTFQGLLLQATPTAFGAQPGTPTSFNLDLKVTGGELAGAFGPSVYMEFHSAIDSAFDGNFARSFSTRIDSSNTLGYQSPAAAAVPEPTTLAVLLAGGLGLVILRGRHAYARTRVGSADMRSRRGTTRRGAEAGLASAARSA